MDAYKVIANFSCKIVFLFIFVNWSYPAIPDDLVRIGLLLSGCLFLFYYGIVYSKAKRYFPTMFAFSLSLLPWCFFLEIRLMKGTFIIDKETFITEFSHAMAVYNLYRYALVLCILIIFIKDFMKDIKKLHGQN